MQLRLKQPSEVKLWDAKIRSPNEEKSSSIRNEKRKQRREWIRKNSINELPRMNADQKRIWGKAGRNRQRKMEEQALRRTEKREMMQMHPWSLKQYRKIFRTELLNILNLEVRKSKRKEEMISRIRQEQSYADKETETRQQIGGSVLVAGKVLFLPVNTLAKRVSAEIKDEMLKYAAFLAVPIILVFFLIQIFLSAVSCISGNEAVLYGAEGAEIVSYAKQWIGVTKYVLGAGRDGPTDWQDYTDCSGFVQGVFLHFGYSIGSYTGTQQNAGIMIEINSLDEAIPGDIVLFYKNNKVDPKNHEHVGIYAGDGNMIHCAGGSDNRTIATAGIGVVWGTVSGDGRPWMVRRIVTGNTETLGSGGYKKDQASYNQTDMELIWAIVAQEDNGSYEGALAVISSAMNRTESPEWSYLGKNALSQLTAPGQYCYSNDDYWRERLDGNVPSYVKQAVDDCLNKGVRNHRYTSFRSKKGSQTGNDAVQIGGNWFFGS